MALQLDVPVVDTGWGDDDGWGDAFGGDKEVLPAVPLGCLQAPRAVQQAAAAARSNQSCP